MCVWGRGGCDPAGTTQADLDRTCIMSGMTVMTNKKIIVKILPIL